jgi:hypothetical protein
LNTPVIVGSALSLALRLRNKKRGASQTQSEKKVATSPKLGGLG